MADHLLQRAHFLRYFFTQSTLRPSWEASVFSNASQILHFNGAANLRLDKEVADYFDDMCMQDAIEFRQDVLQPYLNGLSREDYQELLDGPYDTSIYYLSRWFTVVQQNRKDRARQAIDWPPGFKGISPGPKIVFTPNNQARGRVGVADENTHTEKLGFKVSERLGTGKGTRKAISRLVLKKALNKTKPENERDRTFVRLLQNTDAFETWKTLAEAERRLKGACLAREQEELRRYRRSRLVTHTSSSSTTVREVDTAMMRAEDGALETLRQEFQERSVTDCLSVANKCLNRWS